MADNVVMVVLGRKGSGKSTLVDEVVAEHPRVIIIDSLAEYPKRTTRGWKTAQGKQECLDLMLAHAGKRSYRLALRTLDVEENLQLMEMAYEYPRGLLVVEETSLYAKSNYLPHAIAQLVRYGRHREIDQIYVARRPSELARDLTAQADLIVTFEQREPRDIKYLRDTGGELAEYARDLPPYRVLVFGDLTKAPATVIARRWSPIPRNQLDAFEVPPAS
jgi:hypothetical protein